MKMTKNTIALYKGFVSFSVSTENNLNLALTVQANLMQYGYMLSQEALDYFSFASRNEIIQSPLSQKKHAHWLSLLMNKFLEEDEVN